MERTNYSREGIFMFDDIIEQMTYDEIAGMGYIYLTEPFKFEGYTDELPENPDIILDLGIEVPIIGVELGGKSAKKLAALNDQDKLFKRKTENGQEFFSFRLENKSVIKSVTYEGIDEIRFLFADYDCLDFIGIEIYSNNPYYHEYLCKS